MDSHRGNATAAPRSLMTDNTVAVLGAGMVGVATLGMQRRGMRHADGPACARAGNFVWQCRRDRAQLAHALQPPKLWGTLPSLLRNQGAGFRYSPSFVASNLGWALGFVGRARQSVFETTAALDDLIRLSTAEHRRLLGEVNALHRLRDNGWLFLYRSAQAFDAPGAQLGRETMARFGIATQALNAGELRDLEPVLQPVFSKALWIRDSCSVNSPGAVVKAYADAFVARGGRLQTCELRTLRSSGESRWQIVDGTAMRRSLAVS